MSIEHFWIYIGSFLVCSILLTAIVLKFADSLTGQIKRPVFTGIVSSIAASFIALALTLITNDYFVKYWILGFIFLIFGITFYNLFQKKYFQNNSYNSIKLLVVDILYAISIILFTIVVFSSLQYFLLKNTSFPFFPMLMCSLMFFIPFLVMHSFKAAYNIPSPEYKTWQYPIHQVIELPDEDMGEKILVIGFEIAKKPSDVKPTYFRAKAPETMKLGDLFYHFINDYNDLHSETVIEYTDDQFEPHRWLFIRKPMRFQKIHFLNPSFSIRENGIQENSIIICERI